MVPDAIKKFIAVFEKLPSIGPRQAMRLAFRLIQGGRASIEEISSSVANLKNVKVCPRCFFVYEGADPMCALCADATRQHDIFMIIEKETDLMTIERTGKYRGLYCVIGDLVRSGVLEPWQKMRLGVLKKIIEELPEKKAGEIIIALNPTTYGDLTASLIVKELKDSAQTISRLGRGIPTGGEIEFADDETLSHSLQRRG